MKKLSIPWFCLVCILQSCANNSSFRARDLTSKSDSNNLIAKTPDTGLIAFSALSSLPVSELLCQNWTLTDVDQPHWNSFLWDSQSDSKNYPSLNLFPDKQFTENPRMKIRMGSWSLDKAKRQLILHYDDGSLKNYFIESLAFGQMVAEIGSVKISDTARLTFNSDLVIHKQISEDPFYPENNRWRIKPRRPESKELIRARLKACVRFFYLFFKDNSQRRAVDISFIGLPRCFEWYDGGIGMAEPLEVDEKWKNCFYSDDQAGIAYDMLKNVLEKHKFEWPPHYKGWIFQTYTVLDQIYAQL